ncbi:hypothetical protein BC830DRAFT_513883 [Chytriomyces sp. MP71]|nr:hypothetical protein BC830DRAFT_513883 [Chytriomyces sp. MP71]
MTGTDPHGSTQNDQQSRVLHDSPREQKEGHETFGSVKDQIHNTTAKAGEAVDRATTSAPETLNKTQDSDACGGAKDQIHDPTVRDEAGYETASAPELSNKAHETDTPKRTKDQIQSTTGKAGGDEVGHETASAPDLSNKVQDLASDTSSDSSKEAKKPHDKTKNDQQSCELPESPQEKKEGHGMFNLGSVKDKIYDAIAKAGDASKTQRRRKRSRTRFTILRGKLEMP